MKSNKNFDTSLSSLHNTISNCDNKAGVLLTAVGIVFGFSLFSVRELSEKTGLVKTLSYIFGLLYILFFVISLILLVLIVIPRRRNKKESENKIEYPFYSEDLYNHSEKEDLIEFIRNGSNEKSLVDQIKICCRISHEKETLLRYSVFSIILFSLFLVALIVCLFL